MAVTMRQTYVNNLPTRIDAAITAAAQAALSSFTVTVSYVPAGDGFATQTMNDYKRGINNDGGGWTNSSIDTVAKTITIAP